MRNIFRIFNDDAHDFKPLLAEIEDRPLNPLGRFVFWVVVLSLLCGGIWLWTGKTDIVVSARGKVVVKGPKKTVHAKGTGVLSSIECRPGDFVKKGEALLTIRPHVNGGSGNSDVPDTAITAPVSGYIDTLWVTDAGSRISPLQKLVLIRPEDAPLVIETLIMNKDIGFVKRGMLTAIKVDAFNFQRYGLLKGKIEYISQADHPGLGPVFKAVVFPIEGCLEVEGRKECLIPGLTVTSEIVVGKRRLIEFFIYPLVKYLDEGFSVR